MRTLLIAGLLVLTACATTEPPPPDTRTFARGTPRAEVLAAEPSEPIIATADRLVYHVRRAGVPFTLTYRLAPEGVRSTSFFNRAAHDDNNRYIEDFEALKAELIERHGLPRVDRMAWRNRMLADQPARYGDAVAAGHLVYFARWRTGRGEIVMALRGERLQVAHEITYLAADSASAGD